MPGFLVNSPAQHIQDFLAAAVVIAITGAVAVALASFDRPRLAFAVAIIGFFPVAERMYRVWRDARRRSARVASALVVIVASLHVFAMGALSVQAADAPATRLGLWSAHPAAFAGSVVRRPGG